MSCRRPAEAGFLLSDMLVTLTVSAFVLVGLTGLSALLLRTADRSVAGIEASDDLDRTVTRLAALIGTAARARFAGTEPQPFIFNGDATRLMIVRNGRGEAGPPGLQVLAFRSEESGTLWRAEAPLPVAAGSIGDLHFGPARVSYGGSAHLRFSYLGSSDPNAPAAWMPLWPIGMRMPEAVAIEALDAAGRHVLARRAVPIVADAEIGCLGGGFCGRLGAAEGSAGAGASGGRSALPVAPAVPLRGAGR